MPLMDCQSTSEHLNALLDGELSQELAEPLEAHLVRCQNCAHELRALEKLGSALRATRLPAPASLDAKIAYQVQAGPPRLLSWSANLRLVLPRLAAVFLGALAAKLCFDLLDKDLQPSPRKGAAVQRVMFELQSGLDLAGSFETDFLRLRRSPEGRLLGHMFGERQ